MSLKEIQVEELFGSKEMARKLNIADVTVRKYSQMLNNLAKEELFHFEGNKRMYTNSDYIALRDLIFLKDSTAMSLDSVITDVYIKYYERYKTVSEVDMSENVDFTVYNIDMKLIFEELNGIKEELTTTNKKMELMMKENRAMREIINQKALEHNEEKEQLQQTKKEKKGFWKNLFS